MVDKRKNKGQQGFGLAELLIVLLIISIIVVLALPQIISSRRLFRFSGMQRQMVATLRDTRQEAMSQRNLFAGDDWIIWERCQLVYRANSWAKAYDIPKLVSLAEVEAVESLAVGHVDYASKLTLYVAELIYGQRMPL